MLIAKLPEVTNGRLVRLACLIHAASVHPGPGSNPQEKTSQSNKKISFYFYFLKNFPVPISIKRITILQKMSRNEKKFKKIK